MSKSCKRPSKSRRGPHRWRVEVIHWVDSTRADGWMVVADPDTAADMLCISVGVVLNEGVDSIQMSTTVSLVNEQLERYSCLSPFSIPKAAILSRRRLAVIPHKVPHE